MKKYVLLIMLMMSSQLLADGIPNSAPQASTANLNIQDFYQKSTKAYDILIQGSVLVNDKSLKKTKETLEVMLSKRPDIVKRMLSNGATVSIIAPQENYCDLPEARSLKGEKTFFDKKARTFCELCGAGGVIGRPMTAICEINLLKTKDDPYHGTEDILTHEFAHSIHLLGLNFLEKATISRNFNSAKKNKFFNVTAEGKKSYLVQDEKEFFACMSVIWFGQNNPKSPVMPPGLINRESIKENMPNMYDFLLSIYPD